MPRIRRIDRSSYNVGQIVWGGAATAVQNTLLCDGSAVSRTVYATLFARIGTAFGAGDGSTTFNIPDFRSRMPLGAGAGSGLTARSVGQYLGEELVGLTNDHLPAHSHVGTTTPYANEHSHSYNYPLGSKRSDAFGGASQNYYTYQTGAAGAHTHTVTAASPIGATTTGLHNNMSPFLALNFFIAYK